MRHTRRFGSVFLFAVAAASTISGADTITLAPAADNTLFRDRNFPEHHYSNGAGEGLFCGRTSVHAEIQHRGLIRFDLGAIPCGATVTGVELTLTVSTEPPFGAVVPMDLHRLLAAWGEGASVSFGGRGVPSQPGDANWFERVSPGILWTTPGGDFVTPPSGTTTVPLGAATATWSTTPQMLSDVQGWLATPSTNHGWILVGGEQSPGSVRQFFSRDVGNPALRPRLRVDFTPPTPLAVQGQPSDQTSCPNLGAPVSVQAMGASGFQWQWRANAMADWTPVMEGTNSDLSGVAFVAAGSSAATVTITPEVPSREWLLRCLVSSSCETVASEQALFTSRSTSDPVCASVTCDPDVNQDGNADQGDIDYLINVVAGGENPSGIDPDFNRDGNADQGDVDSLINVVAGGNCP
ncbi:MAG: DNRLRE domain-containing protein [Phycisphaerales bacterium]|jgi:hypothetical protein